MDDKELGEEMGSTMAEMTTIIQHANEDMLRFRQSLMSGMVNYKWNHAEDRPYYTEDDWPPSLVPDTAVELVDEMF